MIVIPWLDEEKKEITLKLGDRMLELTRFNINDSRTVSRRDKRNNDLVMYQKNRPRPQSYRMAFGPYLTNGTFPPAWNYKEFKRLMRTYPGWIATMTLPDETIYQGIINNPIYKEIGDCQMLIEFDFDVLREFPQGEVPV